MSEISDFPDYTAKQWAELIVDNGEGGAQVEIKNPVLRESLVLNAEKQVQRLLNALRARSAAHEAELKAEHAWQPINTAPENIVVETKLDDAKEMRNVQTLKRRGRLWFVPDGAMYVYYTPTHWRAATGQPEGEKDD